MGIKVIFCVFFFHFFRYLPPSRKSLLKSLEEKKNEVEDKVKKEILSSEGIAITHDGWTSNATESYNTTTAYYLQNWEMRSAVLDTSKMEGSHTSEKIAESLVNSKQRWSFPESCYATTDNAANERKAFQILNWQRFGCFGHRINLIVKNSLNIPQISQLLGKARKLVTLLHTSSSVNDKLREKQKILKPDTEGHKLIADVQTRWNSTLMMLERLLEQMPVLMAVATDDTVSKTARTTLQNCIFSFDEVSVAEKLVNLLEPFKKATEVLCSEKIPTINKVLPVISKLERVLVDKEDDPRVILSVKQKMRDQMESRMAAEDLAVLGCILNPFTKDFQFFPDMKSKAEDLLKASIKGVNLPEVKVKLENNSDETLSDTSLPLPTLPTDNITDTNPDANKKNQPPVKKMKSADTEDWLSDIVCVGESQNNEDDVVQAEVERYLGSGMKKGDENCTVLQWWKKNEMFYPRVALLAKRILCVQASSVPSERVFSLAGELVSKKRSRLTPENVDMFIFLNKNINKFW